jgi:hypothetical protein
MPVAQSPKPTLVPLFALGVLAKLALVSTDELNVAPSDPMEFAFAAMHMYFNQPYNQANYARLPTFPFVLNLFTILGVPARIGLELLWAGASWTILLALRSVRVSPWLALAAGLLTLLTPASFEVFNALHADSVYAAGILILIASASAACTSRSPRQLLHWSMLAAIGAALTNARLELIITHAIVAFAGLWLLVSWRLGLMSRSLALARLAAVVLIPLLTLLAINSTIRSVNARSIGSAITQDLNTPGIAALHKTLLAITPDQPSLEMHIPRDVRLRAYAASPTFARLRPALEDPERLAHFQRACEQVCQVRGKPYTPGEFGGWTSWAIRAAAWSLEKHRSPADLDAFYLQAADELKAAMARGELPSRFAPFAYIAPEWGLIARDAPRALRDVALALTRPGFHRPVHPAPSSTREQRMHRIFDASALRRASLVTEPVAPIARAFWHEDTSIARLTHAKQSIVRALALLPAVAAALVLLALVALASSRRLRALALSEPVLALVFLLALLVAVGRLLLITLLEIGAVPVQSRYLLPIAGLLPVLCACALHVLLMLVIQPPTEPRPRS